ncbi:MAG: M15 family metallopeptidase [Clostridia bacterium]|nr:M15 family metallopeptidase [Clostridia bacterium]
MRKFILTLLCLGLTFILTVGLAEADDALLVVANQVTPLTEEYVPDGLVSAVSRINDEQENNINDGVYLAVTGTVQLCEPAYNALVEMFNAAEQDGVTLFLRAGYRSYNEQETLYKRAAKSNRLAGVQPAGECDYQTGLAATVVGEAERTGTITEEFGNTKEGQWLADHAAEYGFIIRYPKGKEQETGNAYEPWHIRYVGKTAAKEIASTGITLEAYVAQLNGTQPAALEVPAAAPAVTEAPADDEDVNEDVLDDVDAEEDEAEEEAPEADEPEADAAEDETEPDAVPEADEPAEAEAAPEAAPAAAEPVKVEWDFPVALEDMSESYLLLVNASHPVDKSYVPDNLSNLRSRSNDAEGNNLNNGINIAVTGKVQLCRAAYNALNRMFNIAESQGIILYVRGGYRSYKDQASIYTRSKRSKNAGFVEPAGESDFQTGLAVTVVGEKNRIGNLSAGQFSSSVEGQWLKMNAPKYGFIVRYPQGKDDITGGPYQPWHLRFVGVKVAEYITENNLTLEEFTAARQEAMNKFVTAGGDIYAAITEAQVPAGPAVLKTTGPDGDHEITLFHD